MALSRKPLALSAIALVLGLFGVAHASFAEGAARPEGPVTRVVVKKSDHTLTLYDGDRPVGTYKVAIGPGGRGPKLREGDKITPVGHYRVVSRNPSRYRVFLRLDYPNATDRARFADLKRRGLLDADATIGGNVGIHGAPPDRLAKPLHKAVDWTLGCVALDDDEIVAISKRVKDGTPVEILD